MLPVAPPGPNPSKGKNLKARLYTGGSPAPAPSPLTSTQGALFGFNSARPRAALLKNSSTEQKKTDSVIAHPALLAADKPFRPPGHDQQVEKLVALAAKRSVAFAPKSSDHLEEEVSQGNAKKRAKTRTITQEKALPPHKDPFMFIEAVKRNPTTLEFVYLVTVADDLAVYNPYWLEIVDHSEIRPMDYYTMSAAGVTHFMDGTSADFTPLDQWEREFLLFRQIMNIPMFRKFRMWKAYSVWRKNVRNKKMTICRDKINATLFILNPVIRTSLLTLRDLSLSIKKHKLFEVSDKETYTLDAFVAAQETKRNMALGELAKYSENVRMAVRTACERILNGLSATASPAGHHDSGGSGGGGGGGGGGGAKNALDEPPKMSYTDMAARRSECRRLTSFIRLADFLVIDTLHGLTMDAVYSLLQNLVYLETGAPVIAPALPSAAAAAAAPTTQKSGHASMANSDDEVDPDIAAHRGGGGSSSRIRSRRSTTSGHSDGNDDDQDMDDNDKDYDSGSGSGSGSGDETTSGGRRSQRPGSGSGSGDEADHANHNHHNHHSHSRRHLHHSSKAAAQAREQARIALDTTLGIIAADYGPVVGAHRDLPLFEVEVQFVNDSLTFSPTGQDFQKAIMDDLLAEFIRTVDSVDRLLKHEDFKDYTAPSSGTGRVEVVDTGEGPELHSMILVDTKYQRLSAAIGQSLVRLIQDVDAHTRVFQPFRQMHMQNRVMTLDFLRSRPDLHNLVWFKEAIEKYLGQRSQIEAIVKDARIGIVRANHAGLKQTFLPSPQSCLDAIHTLLPELARTRNEELLVEVNDAVQVLETPPTDVASFVAFLSFTEEVNGRLDEMQRQFQVVAEMYALMETYQIHISPEEAALYQTLPSSFQRLKATISFAESGREKQIIKFSGVLQGDIAEMNQDVAALRERAGNPIVSDVNADIDEVLVFVDGIHSRMMAFKAQAKDFARYQEIFQTEVTRFEDLDDAAYDINLKKLLWDSLKKWIEMSTGWNSSTFQSIDADEISTQVQRFSKVVHQVEKGLPDNPAVPRLKQLVDAFKLTLPVVVDLRNPSLKPRHWAKFEDIIGQKLARDDRFTLGLLMEMKVMDYKDAIAAVSLEATNEAVLAETLAKVEAQWARTEFAVLPHKDYKDVFIIGGVDDIIIQLEDSRVTVSTIKASRYVAAIQQEVDEWDRNLQLFAETLEEWINCQRQWMYLESIFSAPDIQKQLPAEAKMFQNVDRSWRELMRKTRDNPNALRCSTGKGTLDMFRKANAELDKIQKCLEEYLETKRYAFPRFYFLSNDELLEILAQTKNPHAVQPHLRKCFDSIKRLEFSDDPKSIDIIAMISAEGERVQLGRNLKARGNVEVWLLSVEESMLKSLKRLAKIAVGEYDKRVREQFVVDPAYSAQIVSMITQIYWCRDVVAALTSASPGPALKELVAKCKSQITGLVGLIRGDLTPLQRGSLEALITLDVHSRDIVEELARDGIADVLDYGWTSRLRYTWDADLDDCVILQTNASFVYGYEYLGCTTRLVVTPLTDRCYLTLTGALHLQLGGSPAGPAGTGKTETVKDLSKALARQCVVFNCSDGLDFKMMGRFFSGLAMCGAWCCFDEFNRIDIEVLSVIAQQLLTIRSALAAKAPRFFFEGREIGLKPQIGYFITMNPGYAGRTELPDNLKALFRPVSMMIPDYALIAEIILFGAGFESAAVLSKKMVLLYKLASEQLSQQDHYDFGMRAVKSVLVMAGSLKRAYAQIPEDVTLIRALRDSNIPKFLVDDIPLFQGILQDLFPGVTLPQHDYGELKSSIESVLRDKGFEPLPAFVTKVIQFFETMEVRHGVMLVGPTGAGKSTCLRALQDAMTYLRAGLNSADPRYQIVHTHVLNPKCVSMGELYGEFNDITQEWTDGLVASIVRLITQDETVDHKWVVFDGPVDALWIENMNTVLDDNKTLCLANSERIKLNPTIHMVFEVADLAVASPATVSRCGMVYMEPVDLGWRPYVKRWLATSLGPELCGQTALDYILQGQFEPYIDAGLRFVRTECREDIPSTDLTLVVGLCNIYRSMILSRMADVPNLSLTAWVDPEDQTVARQMVKTFLDQCFAFSYVWSIGGNIESESRLNFDTFFRDTMSAIAAFPGAGTVYDYYCNLKDRSYDQWSDIVPAFNYTREMDFTTIVVPTVDTVRTSYLLSLLVKCEHSVLFNGTTGVGKSVVAGATLAALGADSSAAAAAAATVAAAAESSGSKALAESKGSKGSASQAATTAVSATTTTATTSSNIITVSVIFSAQTSSKRTQDIIESKTEKKRKNIRGAPVGKKICVFVDDLNMPKLDTYGAQPPIELLRQYMDYGGFYDRKKLFWTEYEDLTLVAACAPPGGGRNPVTQRLLRHFNMIYLPAPSDFALKQIFGAVMNGFLASGFNPKVKALAGPLVDASVEVYLRIAQELLPTPAKSHYTFNLRDLSKVFQGLLQARPASVSTPEVMTRLWCHECLRVFHDRLINKEDQRYFTELLAELLRRQFSSPLSHEDVFEKEPILFGDYLRMGVDSADRLYEEVPSMAKLGRLLEDYLDEYNLSTSREMKLVFFGDAMEHVSRIVRIIRQPKGNALLVGVGGSGKQSLTRLACTMAEYTCFQVELTKGYGLTEFREDIKKLINMAAVDRKPVVFLLSDTQIVHESFLEDINNLLNTGEVPNLHEPEEYKKLLDDVRPKARELGFADTRDAVHQCMVNFVRSNLHVVLCMSPVGDAFRRRCRLFPSLVNCCTIDWFSEWPESALASVSKRFLSDPDVDVGGAKVAQALAQMCVTVHSSVSLASERFYLELRRRNYTTPTSYLELINLFLAMLEERRSRAVGSRDKLRNGIQKLVDTNDSVAAMQVELVALQPLLKNKSEETETLLGQVAREQEIADGVRRVVLAEEKVVLKQTEETQVLADDAQADLDTALPILEQAVSALNSLNKNDISEMKSFTNPPPLVMLVMEAVCILCKQKPDWASAKQLLSDVNFLKNLVNFDKDNIDPAVLKKLRKYIDDPQFQPDTVAKQSQAARSLCLWCRAIENYSNVAKVVAPKRARLKEASEALASSQSKLAEKQAKLHEVEEQLANLRKTYETALSEKVTLSERLDDTSKRIQRATKLTSALGDEQVRWAESASVIEASLPNLVGDVFLSAASVAYLGPFTAAYRKELTDRWFAELRQLGVPISEGFSAVKTLGDPVQIREWNICGLPSDAFSIENGVLVTRGRRWPLMIDPQGQANRWIKSLEARNQLKTVRLSEANYMRTLENCIRIGQPALLEHVGETLDPSLEPILLKQTFKIQGRTVIRLGDVDVDYDPLFRFYITTKLANPHYLPETCVKVTVINFTVTLSGLQQQLLGDVVRSERPDLEEAKDRLVVSMAADKKLLTELEDKILALINSSSGNILDDEVLINTLNESKVTSGIIKVRVQEAEETEVEINAARLVYDTVAKRGAILYFAVADLALIDPMYQFSLAYFKRLFNANMESSEKSSNVDERLEIIIRTSTEAIFRNACRGLFDKDKLIFAFIICAQILRDRGEISGAEWSYLIRGNLRVQRETQPENPDPAAFSKTSWDQLCGLAQSNERAFEGLVADVQANTEPWKAYAASDDCVNCRLPGRWSERLTPFQRVLVLKCFREEQIIFAVQDFVERNLGEEFNRPPPFSLPSAFKDSTARSPLVFVISQGADPIELLLRFAREEGYGDRLHTLSLGQGQGPIAAQMIKKGLVRGDWVLLQNCHLAASWMPQLERIVESFESSDVEVHPEFRLWLTSMPSKAFPVAVLQGGLKVTVEAPKGLRTNIARSFANLKDEEYEGSTKPRAWKVLVYALASFHAIIQERRKFGSIGWNITYEFADSDFDTALKTLRMYLDEAPGAPPLRSLTANIGEIIYGGRVTDDNDRRLLLSLLSSFFSPSVLLTEHDTGVAGGHTFSPGYSVPSPSLPLSEVREHIARLPGNENPEVFGLDSNANIIYNLQESTRVLTTILDLQPREAASSEDIKPEDIVSAKAAEILSKLPPNLDVKEATVTPRTGRSQPLVPGNSLSVVLVQEVDRFNRLLGVMRKSLKDLERAIRGLVVMSEQLEAVFFAIFNGTVPALWANSAYNSMRPLGSWVADLHQRVAFFRDWLTQGVPPSFWLPGFFFIQGFLTGVLQAHARKYLIPIDQLSFTFSVHQPANPVYSAESILKGPEDGVLIHGLYIEAAKFLKGELADADPKISQSLMPVLHFNIAKDYHPNPRDYACPAYITQARRGVLSTTGRSTNFVIHVFLKTHVDPNVWVRRGTALLMEVVGI